MKTGPILQIILAVAILATGRLFAEDTKMEKTDSLPAFDTLWDYNDPEATRGRFEAIREDALKSGDKSYYLQLLTQIARTYGLQSRFKEAHALLDTVKPELTKDLKLARVRYLLERGRTFRSDQQPGKAAPLFHEAYDLARDIENDFLAIDAAHMIALIEKTTEEKLKWNHAAIELAEKTTDPKAHNWLGSLYNNMGWFLHDEEQYERALEIFQRALAFREKQEKPREIGIAKWCIARTLRSLNRLDEALEMQLALLEEHKATGQPDGYVFEELAELYNLKGETDTARDYFAKAYTELSKDVWLVNNESDRLARLKKLGGLEDE